MYRLAVGDLQDWLASKRGGFFRVVETRAFNLRNPDKTVNTRRELVIEVMDHPVVRGGQAAVAKGLVRGHPDIPVDMPVAIRLTAPLDDDMRGYELLRKSMEVAAFSREKTDRYPALLTVHETFKIRVPFFEFGSGQSVVVWGEIIEWGTPLKTVVQDRGVLSEGQAVALFPPLLRTVDRLGAEQRLVHRDIDEGNVFLVNGKLKLGDFGAVTTYAEGAQYTGTSPMGKRGQFPPECWLSSPVTGSCTDAWLLGRLLFFLLTKASSPYAADMPLGEKFHPYLSRLSEGMQGFVRGLCAPAWEERFTLSQAVEILATYPAMGNAAGVAPTQSAPAPAPTMPLTTAETLPYEKAAATKTENPPPTRVMPNQTDPGPTRQADPGPTRRAGTELKEQGEPGPAGYVEVAPTRKYSDGFMGADDAPGTEPSPYAVTAANHCASQFFDAWMNTGRTSEDTSSRYLLAEGACHCVVLDNNGHVYTWGANE